jgi:hypothetical protein
MTRHRLRFAAALLFMVTVQAQPTAGQTLPFVLDAGLPLLQARIDGREARLLIDTGGAAALALRPDWAPVAEDAASASQDAQGQARLNAKLAVAEVALAGQRLSPTPPAQTWSKARRPAGADGYLGWGWLRAQRWVLDYGARQLQLLAADEPMPASCGTAPLGLDMLGSLPVLRLQTAAGQTLTLGLDSGASRNVVRPALAESVVGGALQADGRALQAGDFVTVPLQVPGLDGFLGQDFFSRHRVCVDPARRRLWMQPLAH